MDVEAIPLADIRMDGTQTRDSVDEDTVAEYQSIYEARTILLPPLVVFRDASGCWLADGFHRLQAMIRLKGKTARCEVHPGGKRDAIRFGFTANNKHGRRRTNADKRRAVRIALEDEEWGKMSDREIAELCGVDGKTVASVRSEFGSKTLPNCGSSAVESEEPEKRIGKDGKARKVKPKPEPKSDQDPEPEPVKPARQPKNGRERVGTEDRKNAAKALGALIRALDKIGIGLAMAEHTRAIDAGIKAA